jgi:hypothetical protein
MQYCSSSDAFRPTVRIWLATGHHGEQFFPHRGPPFPLFDWRQFESPIPYIECISCATLLLMLPFRSVAGVRPARLEPSQFFQSPSRCRSLRRL